MNHIEIEEFTLGTASDGIHEYDYIDGVIRLANGETIKVPNNYPSVNDALAGVKEWASDFGLIGPDDEIISFQ
tara:strand:+ start:9101 stop:9319 length:219 start_codon:yes stop_codon:yes gene_type:complete